MPPLVVDCHNWKFWTIPPPRKGSTREIIGLFQACRFRKLKFVRIDGAVRQGSDAQRCLRTARLSSCAV